jgi:hypothetical protein
MIKKIYRNLFFFIFLYIGFFCSPINKALADLEVQYPTLPSTANQSIGSVTDLPSYVKYIFVGGIYIGFFCIAISLAIAGIMYFLSPINPSMRASAKDRISGAISGLLIFTLSYLIITTINPELNVFSINKLPETKVTVITTKTAPGVYFYTNPGCSDDKVTPDTGNVADLGKIKRKTNSVKIVQDSDNGTSYVSIAYENPDFWGKCQYVNPDGNCQTISPFASSASIYQYDFDPTGDGVYFFRKSCFNDGSHNSITSLIDFCSNRNGDIKNSDNSLKDTGGYYEIKNSDIKGIYVGKLDDLTFTGVSDVERDCTKYDKNDRCTGRKDPTLGGENISSIIVNGNYLVLFVYMGKDDSQSGPWTSCQEFPTSNDVNKLGPRQMKWDAIRNSGGVVPNYVIIIPVKNQTSKSCTSSSDCISGQTCSNGACADTTQTLTPIPAS